MQSQRITVKGNTEWCSKFRTIISQRKIGYCVLLSQTATPNRLLLKWATIYCWLQWEQRLISYYYVYKIRHALILLHILNWWFHLYGTDNLEEQPLHEFSLSRNEKHRAPYALFYVQWVFHCIMTDHSENTLT